MTAPNRLERDLTVWLADEAAPSTPDYAADILGQTARVRQRPRWTFVLRRLPIPNLHVVSPLGGRVAWRTVGVLVLLTLLLAGLAVFVGSRPRVPTPFGPATNGLIAHGANGDIFILDPETARLQPIATGPDDDHEPRWSRDGTRLAFLRGPTEHPRLVVVAIDGTVVAVTKVFNGVDTDSIAWSPDGRSIAITGGGSLGSGIYIVDASDGSWQKLSIGYHGLEVFWRPPDGRQLLFRSHPVDAGLRLVSLEDRSIQPIPLSGVDLNNVRPLGWTPDGRAVLYQDDAARIQSTYVVDVMNGSQTQLDVAFGHISSDGSRVAGLGHGGQLCIVAITGGPCRLLPGRIQLDGTHGAALSWSPDDRWIVVSELSEKIWLVDATGSIAPRAIADGGPVSWQRVAP